MNKILLFFGFLCLFLMPVLLLNNVSGDVISLNWIGNESYGNPDTLIEGFGFGEIPSVVTPGGGGGAVISYKLNNTICNLIKTNETGNLSKGIIDFHKINCPKPLEIVPEGELNYWWIIFIIALSFGMLIVLDVFVNKRRIILFLIGRRRRERD